MRLDKYLADCGIASRSQIKNILKQKRVRVNDHVVTSGKFKVDEKHTQVYLDDTLLQYERFVYYMLNKPKGVISATVDEYHTTVIDLLNEADQTRTIFPVGRLDIDTHGLLLLTNNGALAHAMLSPKKHVKKCYFAKVTGIVTREDCKKFEEGIQLEDGYLCLPARLEIQKIDEKTHESFVKIEIEEGKFHQIKRMFRACGKQVIDLKRVSMGPLILDEELKSGEYRPLTERERLLLRIFQVEI